MKVNALYNDGNLELNAEGKNYETCLRDLLTQVGVETIVVETEEKEREFSGPHAYEDFAEIEKKLPRAVGRYTGDTFGWAETTGPKKGALDCAGSKRVSVWALIYNGESAGRVLWDFGPCGDSNVVCTIQAYKGPLEPMPMMNGRAGGYGYCKRSAAFADALDRAGIETGKNMSGAGESICKRYLGELGYVVAEVL